MDAVFVDVIMVYKFCLPPHALCFSALSFHILHYCLVSPSCFLSTTLCPDFHRTKISITILTFELQESKRKSPDMLEVKDIAFINSTPVFSFKHIFKTDLASMAGEINM